MEIVVNRDGIIDLEHRATFPHALNHLIVSSLRISFHDVRRMLDVLAVLPRVGYPKGEESLASGRWNVDASRIGVLAFGRDDALEGL